MGLLVLAGEQRLTSDKVKTYEDWVDARLRPDAARQGVTLPALDVVSGEPLPAIVNANRWIVECPVCNGAEFAWKEWPLFLCATCWNGANGYAFRPVVFPDDVEAIERVLMARPVPDRRNWLPGESVADLMAENEAHGLPKGVG